MGTHQSQVYPRSPGVPLRNTLLVRYMINCISSILQRTFLKQPLIYRTKARKSSLTEQPYNYEHYQNLPRQIPHKHSHHLYHSITDIHTKSSPRLHIYLRLSLPRLQARPQTKNRVALVRPRPSRLFLVSKPATKATKDIESTQNLESEAHDQSIRNTETKVWLFQSILFEARSCACIENSPRL
jgi:hypothetical protein